MAYANPATDMAWCFQEIR